jgi:hypothetical protein
VMSMKPSDPRWDVPGLRALIAFDSVHAAREAARAFEAARGIPQRHLTSVTVDGGALVQFVRVRDQADLDLFKVPQPDDPRRDKKVFQYIEFTYAAPAECVEHMRQLCTDPGSKFVAYGQP